MNPHAPLPSSSADSGSESPTDVLSIWSYHAHIYFDGPDQRGHAALLRERIAERFAVQLGRWHEVPVGPHTLPMYQVAFARELFPLFVPWLLLNRLGLTVLVHPNTGRPLADHVSHALWLGQTLTIREDPLPEVMEMDDDDRVHPNTTPTREPCWAEQPEQHP